MVDGSRSATAWLWTMDHGLWTFKTAAKVTASAASDILSTLTLPLLRASIMRALLHSLFEPVSCMVPLKVFVAFDIMIFACIAAA